MGISGVNYVHNNYSSSSNMARTNQEMVDEFYSGLSSAATKVEKDDIVDKEDILGLTFINMPGTNMNYGMVAKSANNSTTENPIIQVSSNYGGKSIAYDIEINKINPANATELEMFALCSYADEIGKGTGNTFGSYSALKYYSCNSVHNGYFEEVNTMDEFRNLKLNWEAMVSVMMKNYYSAGSFEQYKEGLGLQAIFALVKANRDGKLIGEISNQEWDNLLKKVDTAIEIMKKETKEDIEKRIKADIKNRLVETDKRKEENIKKKLEEASYKKLFENTAEKVEEAWKLAEKETSVNAFGKQENDIISYLPQLQVQMLLGENSDNSYNVLGTTYESAYSFASNSLSNINITLTNDIQIQKFKEKEKEFYKKFINNLSGYISE